MAVDWSAATTPRQGPDSVWVAIGGRRGPVRTHNPPTRGAAEELIAETVDRSIRTGERVLLGYDFSFGYPWGAAALFPGSGPRWSRPWVWLERRLHDTGATNRNDRFDVAAELNVLAGRALFFGRPAGGDWAHLSPTKRDIPVGLAPNPFPAFRATEIRARAQTGSALCSGWHLYGGVCVGSQILTGLAHLQRLRRRFGAALAVWPQETGFGPDPIGTAPSVRAVVAELWPTALASAPVRGPGVVRDRIQVRDAVVACRRRQASPSGLGGWFDPPSQLDAGAAARRRSREEGWILGVD